MLSGAYGHALRSMLGRAYQIDYMLSGAQALGGFGNLLRSKIKAINPTKRNITKHKKNTSDNLTEVGLSFDLAKRTETFIK